MKTIQSNEWLFSSSKIWLINTYLYKLIINETKHKINSFNSKKIIQFSKSNKANSFI